MEIISEDIPIPIEDLVNNDKSTPEPAQTNRRHVQKNTCIARTENQPCPTLLDERINTKAQKMNDHALV